MSNQNLIIYENIVFYDILNEIAQEINFTIIKYNKNQLLKLEFEKSPNYLLITNKQVENINNQIVITKFPISILKLIEKINIEFLRLKFNSQSKIKISNYLFDLNSREMIYQNEKLKLTEKEINSIIYLFNLKKPANVEKLQVNVWGYQSELETHTVETHIYRLRKKILKKFNDNQFIKSTSNGYQVN